MQVAEISTLVEVCKVVELTCLDVWNKVASVLLVPTSWKAGEVVLLVLPLKEAKLIDTWSDFALLFLSTMSAAVRLLSAEPLVLFRDCLDTICLAGETGSLGALLWVDSFKVEFVCLVLLGEARISSQTASCSINNKVFGDEYKELEFIYYKQEHRE